MYIFIFFFVVPNYGLIDFIFIFKNLAHIRNKSCVLCAFTYMK